MKGMMLRDEQSQNQGIRRRQAHVDADDEEKPVLKTVSTHRIPASNHLPLSFLSIVHPSLHTLSHPVANQHSK